MAECNKPDDLSPYVAPYDNPTDPVKIIENCTDMKTWITTTFRTWGNSVVEYVSCALEDIGLKKESIDKTKEQIDTIKSEIDVNLEAVKALCGTKWLGEWNDTDDFAQSTVEHNGVVYASLITPPDTHIGDEPPSANWRKITFEVVDDTSPTLGGDLDTNGKTFDGSSYRQQPTIDSTATTTIDFLLGDVLRINVVGDMELEFVNFVEGKVCTMYVDIVHGEDWMITYPSGTFSSRGKAPKLTGGIDRLLIVKDAQDVFTVSLGMSDIKEIA